MAMDVGPRGGVGYDASTHRAGTDWNRNGSIDMADGAMNMLVMDYVMREEGDESQSQSSAHKGCPRQVAASLSDAELAKYLWPEGSEHGRQAADPPSESWLRTYYPLVALVIMFVIVFVCSVITGLL